MTWITEHYSLFYWGVLIVTMTLAVTFSYLSNHSKSLLLCKISLYGTTINMLIMLFWVNICTYIGGTQFMMENAIIIIFIVMIFKCIYDFVSTYNDDHHLEWHYCINSITSIIIIYGYLYSSLIHHDPLTIAGTTSDDPIALTIDMLYFSIATFTTVGFGDITPITTTARFVVSTQIIIAFFIMVLFISLHPDHK